MRARDHSAIIATAISLLLHGGILALIVHSANTGSKPEPAADDTHSVQLLIEVPQPPEVVRSPDSPPPLPPSVPMPTPEEPPPALEHRSMPEIKQEARFGESSGQADATAVHSSPGDQPMQALQGEQDQPALRKDAHESDRSDARPAENRPLMPDPPLPRPVELARQGDSFSRDDTAGAIAPSDVAGVERTATSAPAISSLTSPPSSLAPSVSAASQTPADGGEIAAEPAGAGENDSDPFSTVGSVEFRPGRVVARFGRRIKTVRPRLSLAGEYDLISLRSPSVVVNIRADETGRVREVTVAKSSGSAEVDQPTVLAIYQWWFEPPRDAAGRPQPSDMTWTIHWRAK